MKPVVSWNLEGLGTLGRLGLKGLFNICVLQLYSLVDQFSLGGSWKGFSPSTSVSFSIIRLSVILYLHFSSLTLCALHLLFIASVYALD